MDNMLQENESRYTLYHGDCLEIMKGIPNGSVDAIICDLPYGITACKWDTVIPFEPLWEQYKRVIKPRGGIVLFGSEPFSSYLRMSNIKQYKYDWIWDKVTARGHLAAKKRPMKQTENISVFCAGTHNYYPIMEPRPLDKIEVRKKTEYARTSIMGGKKGITKETIYDTWYPKTILRFSNAGSSVKSVHPTQKPVPLLEYLIKTYTNEGDTVLDNCFGSCSTGIACLNTGRNFIGIEMDDKYFQLGLERFNKRREELGL